MTLPDTTGPALTPWRGQKREGGVWRPLIVAVVVLAVVWALAAALIQARVFWLALVLHVGPVLVALAALLASAVLGTEPPRDVPIDRQGVGARFFRAW